MVYKLVDFQPIERPKHGSSGKKLVTAMTSSVQVSEKNQEANPSDWIWLETGKRQRCCAVVEPRLKQTPGQLFLGNMKKLCHL